MISMLAIVVMIRMIMMIMMILKAMIMAAISKSSKPLMNEVAKSTRVMAKV